jgi:hypothetical protein
MAASDEHRPPAAPRHEAQMAGIGDGAELTMDQIVAQQWQAPPQPQDIASEEQPPPPPPPLPPGEEAIIGAALPCGHCLPGILYVSSCICPLPSTWSPLMNFEC